MHRASLYPSRSSSSSTQRPHLRERPPLHSPFVSFLLSPSSPLPLCSSFISLSRNTRTHTQHTLVSFPSPPSHTHTPLRTQHMHATPMAARYQPAAGPSRPPHIMTSFPSPAIPQQHHHQQAQYPPQHQPQHGAPQRSDRPVQPPSPSGWTSPTPTAFPSATSPASITSPTTQGFMTQPLNVRREDSSAKRNPFAKLLDTEKIYVEQLTLVIRVCSHPTDPPHPRVSADDPEGSRSMVAAQPSPAQARRHVSLYRGRVPCQPSLRRRELPVRSLLTSSA